MFKIPAFPSGLKPFTTDELAQEEQRQRREGAQAERDKYRQQHHDRLDASYQKVKRRPQRFERIEARYQQRDDRLIRLSEIEEVVATNEPDVTPEKVRAQFLATVECGDFPVIGTGFRREPDRRAVQALVDFYSVNAVLPFAPGQYPLRPSLPTIKAAPLEMRARRSVWVQWIRSQGWKVPPQLGNGPTRESEPNNNLGISLAQTGEATQAEEPMPNVRSKDTIRQTVSSSNTGRVLPAPTRDRVIGAMRRDLAEVADHRQVLTLNELREMTEEALKARYGASRDTCREARKRVFTNPVADPPV